MARLTLNGMYQYDPTLFDGMVLPPDYDKDTLLAEIMQKSGMLYPYHQVPAILKSNIRLWFSRNYLNFDRTMEALMAEYNPIENYNRVEAWTRTPNLTDKSTLSGKDSTQASGKDSDQLSGTDTTALSGTDTTALSGTDTTERTYDDYKETVDYKGSETVEKQVSAFDSSSYQPSEKTTTSRTDREDEKETSGSYADETTYGKSEDLTYGKTEELTYGKLDELTYGRKDETTYGKVDTVTHTGTEGYRSNIHGNIGVTTSQQMITSELELRRFDIYTDIAERFEHEFLVQVY